jgi:hypothetical protein
MRPFAQKLSRRHFLGASAAAFAASGLSAHAENPDPIGPLDIGSEPQYFFDDWIVEEASGFKRTMHKPAKKGLIKEADGRDWERGGVYHGNAVCRGASGHFHMSYLYLWWDPSVKPLHPYIGEDKAHWFRNAIAYAASDDGIHWTRPVLNQIDGPTGFRKITEFPFEEPVGISKANNLGCPFDFIYDLHARGNISDPDRHFIVRVAKKDDTHPFANTVESKLYFAREFPDFINDPAWREKLLPFAEGSLSPRGFSGIAGYDTNAATWFAVSQDELGNWRKRGGRDIARYTSDDLLTWEGPELVLPVAEDESRDPKAYVEYMDLSASRMGGPKTGLWLGQLVIFHGDRTDPQFMMPDPGGSTEPTNIWRKGTTEVRLVTSRDAGKTWQRVGDREAWLPCSEEENGYDRLTFATSTVVVGDEEWHYYSAWDGDHLTFFADGRPFYRDRMRMNRTALATIRKGGYVSLDSAGEATLVTKTLTFTGDELRINATPGEDFRVELQTELGEPIPGFAMKDCTPITGDGTDQLIRWGDKDRLKEVAGRRIRLHFAMIGGSLYSFRFA